jgi:hypothetical protein
LAFEYSTKHLSFTAAATELNITQSTVSHLERLLEDRLETIHLVLNHMALRSLILADYCCRQSSKQSST